MQIKLLNATHDDYCSEVVERHAALYKGGEEWRERLDEWLPKREAEPEEQWKQRKDNALYCNDTSGLLDLLTGYLFSTPLTLANTPSDWWAAFESDVDGLGTSISTFAANRLTDALIGQTAYVWVNLPKASEATSLLDQMNNGSLNAFLVPLTAEHVINWGETSRGALAWVVIKEEVSVNEFGKPKSCMIRWTYIDSEYIRVFQADEEAKEEDDAPMTDEVRHGFGRLPVTPLNLPDSLYAMQVLADPAIALIRARVASTWNLEKSSYSMLAVYTNASLEHLTGGSGYFVKMPLEGKIEWVEPSGQSCTALADDIDRKRDDLYRAMRSLFSSSHSDSLQGQSGTSKAMDWRSFEVVLSRYAEIVIDFVTGIVSIVGSARKENVDLVTVNGLDGFQQELPADYLKNAKEAMPMLNASPTAQRLMAIQAISAVLPDLSPDDRQTILSELSVTPTSVPSVPDVATPAPDASLPTTPVN